MRTRKRAGSPTIAVAVLRVSTDEQKNGTLAQRRDIERWAARTGVTVKSWHIDQGVSGAAPLDERLGLLAAIEALQQLNAGILVCSKRDRLGRDVVLVAMIERLAERSGARVVSAAGEGTDSNDASGMLLRGMVDLFSQYERALIRLRTSSALRAKRARGERAGTVPFGFTADAAGHLAPEAGEQRVMARARELRAGGLTQRAIVARLDAEGFRSREGKPLQLTQVQKLIAPAPAEVAA